MERNCVLFQNLYSFIVVTEWLFVFIVRKYYLMLTERSGQENNLEKGKDPEAVKSIEKKKKKNWIVQES